MIRLAHVMCLALGALAIAGCTATTATPSVQGKAFIVSGDAFGDAMYNCDASGFRPECWRVVEQEIDQ